MRSARVLTKSCSTSGHPEGGSTPASFSMFAIEVAVRTMQPFLAADRAALPAAMRMHIGPSCLSGFLPQRWRQPVTRLEGQNCLEKLDLVVSSSLAISRVAQVLDGAMLQCRTHRPKLEFKLPSVFVPGEKFKHAEEERQCLARGFCSSGSI